MPTRTTRSDIRLAAHIAALCSLGAAIVHAVVTPNHWQEWWASGVFFAGLAGFQALWGVLVLARPRSRWLLTAALPVNLGAAGLWVASRFWAVPAGPAAGTTEEIGAAGLGATLLGILTALFAGWAVIPRLEHATISKGWHAAVLGSAAVVVALVATPAAIAGPSHSHGSGTHDDGHHDEPAHTEEPTPAPSPSTSDEPSSSPSPTAPTSRATTEEHHDDESHSH